MTSVDQLHRRGVAAASDGHPAVAAGYFHAALRMLNRDKFGLIEQGVSDARFRIVVSLAHAEAERGDPERGLTLLNELGSDSVSQYTGLLAQQRGLMLSRMGRYREARDHLDRAAETLSAIDDPVVLARALLNRSVYQLAVGRPDRARDDVTRCLDVATTHGLELIAAKAIHNLGCCIAAAGDVPIALATFADAKARYVQHCPGFLPVLAIDRARVLLASGLAREACSELDESAEALQRQGLSQDMAEAVLTRASAAARTGDTAGAIQWARLAEERFRERGNHTWAALAVLVRLRTGGEEKPPLAVARESSRLATRFHSWGLPVDAHRAELTAVRALVAAGRLAQAHAMVSRVATYRSSAPLDVQLLRGVARAELRFAQGRRSAGFAAIRQGLLALDRHRARLGGVDQQIAASLLGRELADIGLSAAWRPAERHSAQMILGWSERARSQLWRTSPVRPPEDLQTAAWLAELRQHRLTARRAELGGHPTGQLREKCRRLERALVERSWQLSGNRRATDAVSVPQLVAELVDAGRALVSYLERDGRLAAVTVVRGIVRLTELGNYPAVAEAALRLRADLNAKADQLLPSRIANAVDLSLSRQTRILADALVAPLLTLLAGCDDLVVVPPSALSGIPWSLLPGMGQRAISVAPTATMWWQARRARDAPRAKRPALIAGPHLRYAESEISAIAETYGEADTLRGASATVAHALALLDRAEVVHIAAHGHHEGGNVLFSRLDLADGPLMAYDIPWCDAAPRHVVLSACDVGQSVRRTGDEAFGFTSALLHAGTLCVVSSVARVPDETTAPMMARYHRRLVTGDSPARALAVAAADTPGCSFVCFGAG
jgi:tetratricopeptide (TPR) repeat protein